MKTQIDRIIETLSGGLSESSVDEACRLVDEVVEERVAEQVKLLEAKVASFLRTKLDDLRGVAKEEFEADDLNARSIRIYEAIKTLVAGELDGDDVDSVASEYESAIEELTNTIESLNHQLSVSVTENQVLGGKMDGLIQENQQLEDRSDRLEVQATLPFKSSESAVVITNDPDRKVFSEGSEDNRFLSEDVIRLSQLIEPSINENRS